MGIAIFAWLLHVAAMALAPLSLVQACLSGGLVFLTVLAERVFGFKVGKRQWVGVGLMAIGLALLVVILPQASGAHSHYSHAGMIAFEVGLLFVAVMLVLSPKLGTPHHHHGVLLGLASGLLFGVSDVAIKAITGLIGSGGMGAALSPGSSPASLPRSSPSSPRPGSADRRGRPRDHDDERRSQRLLHRRRHHRLRRPHAERRAGHRAPVVRLRAGHRRRRAYAGSLGAAGAQPAAA